MTPRRADLGGVAVGDGLPVAVMGALNVSPESFYPGSVRVAGPELVEAALRMVEAGAALIDLGARSTAPYLDAEVSEAEETARLARAVEVLAPKIPVPISADTPRPGPARAALDAGARVLNDVSGLADPALARLAAEREVGVILMASPIARSGPRVSAEPVLAVKTLLAAALARARAAGIGDERVVVDPGIGFFRDAAVPWPDWDLQVLARLGALADLGRPLCVGVSRKAFLGAVTGRADPAERLAAALAATAVAVLGGASLIRAHDVAESVDAVRVAERLTPGPR